MRFAPVLLLLAIAPAWAQAQVTKAVSVMKAAGNPRQAVPIAQGTFTGLEKRFDQSLATLFGADDPIDLLGNTRGLYLDGYGAVFTAEVSLVVTPAPNPFRQTIPKELATSVRKRKNERLPFLKAAMKQMMQNMATTFIQVPNNQQMVLMVRFRYEPWEDLNGMPSQILMHADRKSAMAGDIQVEEQ
jgi:hypothetical protein